MTDRPFVVMTDGVVSLRASTPADVPVLIAGRDDESRRWLGPGVDDPDPTACIVVDLEVVGWIDFDDDRDWLAPGEVNVGYQLFPRHRRRGYASRAVQLLLHHFAVRTDRRAAMLSIDRTNDASLAVARRLGFTPVGDHDAQSLDFRRAVPPLTYSDGVVTLRRPRVTDLDADLAAKDAEQKQWMWLPGEREHWEAMTAAEQRAHAQRGLRARVDGFGTGPKWTFSVDTDAAPYAVYVDFDLANSLVPHGEANVSYSAHPAHRGQGFVARSVRLVAEFLRDHTGAREMHVIVDAENEASLRVARAVGAVETERRRTEHGRILVRHVLPVTRR